VRRISSRPSDALALAARYPESVPIYADEAVLDEAGVLFDQDEEEAEIEEFREFLNGVQPEDFASE
jgi:bifunctional DNase/RNase